MKNKRLTITLIILFSAVFVFAQEEIQDTSLRATPDSLLGWKYGGTGNLSFSQAYFGYWAAGGNTSMSTLSDVNAFATFRSKYAMWSNAFALEYGLLYQQNEQEQYYAQKNADRIEFVSKYGYRGYKNWYVSFSGIYKSQFNITYESPQNDSLAVSTFMAPGYIFLVLGMDYKPNDNLSILISPLTSKNTFVLDNRIDETRYGLDEGKKSRFEKGFGINAYYNWNITKDISFENKVDVFSDYKFKAKKVDIDWQGKLFLKVNKYITTTIMAQMIWDWDVKFIDPVSGAEIEKKQFKEVLGVGISYKF